MSNDTQGMPKIVDLSYEEAMRELESIVRRLEEGKINLEEAITAYERGASLKDHCEAKLRDARTKVDQVILAKDGSVSTQPLV